MKKLHHYPFFKCAAALCCIGVFISLFTACPNGQTPKKGVAVTVNVLDSVGGVPITESTVLTVYKVGASRSLYDQVRIVNGSALLYLPKNQRYDFNLSGAENGRAASVIENYWIRTADMQTVTMIQRMIQKGAQPEAPSIQSVTLNGQPFEDGSVWSSAVGQTMKLEIVFTSRSRAIQAIPDNGNFGCAVGIGTSPSSHNNIATVSPVCKRDIDGSWKCTANFSFDKISFPNEFNNFVITAYDVAGNRVERHINSIEFQERRPGLKTIEGASIRGFRVEMHRYPHSLKLFNNPGQSGTRPFGVTAHNGESTTSEVLLWFQIKDLASQDLPIRGFYIYRRIQGQAEWTLVGRQQYAADYTGEQDYRYPSYIGFHLGYDTDPSLEEGVTYEYKVRPFIDGSHYLDSPTATARLLPASTIELINPADNGVVKKSELDNLSFSFKITNPALWDNRLADAFSFGLLITEKASTENVVFAGKVSVALKATAGNRLKLQYAVSGNPKEYSFKELQERGFISGSAVEDDFISYRNGIVTIHPRYLKTAAFNHPLFKDAKFTTGCTYGWDILDWGEDAKNISDNEPAAFTAVWLSKDADGNEIPYPTEPLSSSESFVSHLRYPGSLNGQCYFKVIEE